MIVEIPYGEDILRGEISDEKILDIIEADDMPVIKNFREKVRKEIADQLSKFSELGEESKIAIVVTDRTRPTPNHIIVPELVAELEKYQVKPDNISVISGLGLHAPDSREDFAENIGDDMLEKVNWQNHDCDAKDTVKAGTTSRGVEVLVNRRYYEADIKIGTGAVAPCMFAGWSGGGKIVLPGITGRKTIEENHVLFVDILRNLPRGALFNTLPPQNIVREDIEEAAKISSLDFVINTVLNPDNEVSNFAAGDPVSVHRNLAKYMSEYLEIDCDGKADVLVAGVGSKNYEVSLFQGGSRVLGATEKAIKEEGTMILVSECREGVCEEIEEDAQEFEKWLKELPAPEKILDACEDRCLDSAKGCILMVFSWFINELNVDIILVTDNISKEKAEKINMSQADELSEAIKMAEKKHEDEATWRIIPGANYVFPNI